MLNDCVKIKSFPQQIMREVVNLYQKFNQLLNINSPIVRATGIHFFYNFYQLSNANPPEYAISAISCFHLATKICEISLSYKRYINEIKNSPKSGITSSFLSIFRVLDGIPPANTPDFQNILLKKFYAREMQILIKSNFNFSVCMPYDISIRMIEQILKWHIHIDDQIFLPLRDEINQKCWTFFNDLQISEIYYTNSPEMIALSSIELTFLLFDIPLISPVNSPWFTFLVFDVDSEKLKALTSDIKRLFSPLFSSYKRYKVYKLKTKFDKKIFTDWIRFPLIPLKKVPICPPPSLELLDSLVSGDDSFKNCEYNHVPPFPPPDLHNVMKSPILQQFKNELHFNSQA
ncbi:hypothetical protein M9Y10_013943 [Tritrichomonas musculus]|uniref:Cyclin N-terminal domain-containing protein n=1 Tax=Tritrichomonas musculus TaxID=1915356 RepID=A0ABR2KY74_9EUKA